MPAPVVLTYLGSAVTALGKIGEYLAAPIGRQFTYMCCFNSNITELETKSKELETTRQDAQMGVEDTRRKMRRVGPEVDAWLTKANKVTLDVQEIIQDKAKVNEGCLNGWCPNLKLRYSLSRKAVKTTKVVVEHKADGVQFIKPSYSPLPECMEVIPNKNFMEFESRKLIIEEIITALKPDGINNETNVEINEDISVEINEIGMMKINLIGICGLPGVGKTKMVEEVRERVKEKKLFNEVAFVVVGQKPDLPKLQKRIGESLGIDSTSTRAGLLRERLMQDNKKILLILDDVWEEFDLQDMGIPLGGSNKNFKMLYTSRNRRLWHDVQTKKEISLELLSNDEAWQLFREKAGNLIDAPNLQPIAEQIVDECGRLPLALVIIGSTLSKKSGGNSTVDIWKEMLDRLTCQRGTPADKSLLLSLETSYNYLEDEAKLLFLLCCLFEEDKNILIEDLARYGLGLSLFRGIHEMRKVRRRVITLVDDLMSRYLLLDTEFIGHVKVHDVVRDMGICVASRDKGALVSHGNISDLPKEDTYEDYTSISVILREITEFPQRLRCPNLVFLLLQCRNLDEMPCNFLDGLEKLRVLVLNGELKGPFEYFGFGTCFLPFQSFQSLRSLRTLCLENLNASLDSVSAIGDLEDLEILSLVGCSIDKLPTEIGKLAKLRLLDLTYCQLRRIPPGVISRLVGLEELYMIRCGFVDWEGEGKEEGINASLKEFGSLSKLNTLQVRIIDAALLPKLPIFSKLTNFKIEINLGMPYSLDWPSRRPWQTPNCLSISSSTPIHSDYGGLNLLLRSTEYLALQGEGTSEMVREIFVEGPEGLQLLKALSIGLCATLECVANTMNPPPQLNVTAPAVLPVLEKLDLYELDNLREICHGPVPAHSFGKLKHLFIKACVALEEVIRIDRGEDAHMATKMIEFPKLRWLKLQGLPSLVGFCRGVDKIHFPELRILSVEDVGLVSLFTQEVSLPNLEELDLKHLQNLETLGHGPLSFGSLSKLKQINVCDCDKLLFVFPSQLPPILRDLEKLTEELEWVDASEPNTDILSPVDLTLRYLPQLNYISKRDPVVFKYIHTLDIFECDNLRYVFAPTMTKSIPQLRELYISGCEMLSRIVAEENGLGESSVDEVEFPQLVRLTLHNLPNLMSFFPKVTTTPQPLFNGKVAIPCLKYLELHQLNNPSDIWFSELSTSSFSELKELEVIECENLSNTFHPSMVEALANLEKLVIRNCSKMEAVVDSEEKEQGRKIHKAMFPQLRKMELDSLPSLRMFCHFTCPLEFPLLSEMDIRDCSSMDAFSLGHLSFPKLCLSATSSKDVHKHFRGFAEEQEYLVSLPNLEKLKLINLQNLETLGHGRLSFGSLSKVKQIYVSDCGKLLCVFPTQLLPTLRDLEKLTVELEGVDASEPNTDILSPVEITLDNLPKLDYISKRDPVVFKNIHTLHIFECASLRYVFAPTMTKSIPQLRELYISGCEMLSRIVAEENGLGESSVDEVEFPQLVRLTLQNLPTFVSFFPKGTTTSQPVFNVKVAIPSLKYLELHQLKNPSDIWFSKLSTSSFSELKELEVIDCQNLGSTFHPSMVKALANLEKLVIRNCSKMEAVVDSEEKEQGRKIHKAMFPQLRKMELDSLPSLRMFCHFTCPLEFPLLSEMDIRDCSSMDAFSLGHLSFPKLCLSATSSKDVHKHFRGFAEEQEYLVSLPNLEKLKLIDLQNLETLGHGPLSFGSLSKVKQIYVSDCGKLLCVFPTQLLPTLRDLEKLTVELEGVDASEPNTDILSPVEITLDNLPKLVYISKRDPVVFKNIHTLHIFECASLRYVFAPTMAKSIPQLRELYISGCEVLSSIVAEENRQGESLMDEVEFPQLARLTLQNLPTFVSFFPKGTTTPQPVFNVKVAIPSLKYLELHQLKNPSDIWFSELSTSSFSELKELEVIDCQNLGSTFHPSMVKALANLEKLVFRNCSKMKAVVDSEEKGQGREIDKAMFPQLREMELDSLPNLRMFCPFTCPLEFPQLSQVDICDCRSMDAFSLGHLSFPKLGLPEISSKDFLYHFKRFTEEQDDLFSRATLSDEDDDDDDEDEEDGDEEDKPEVEEEKGEEKDENGQAQLDEENGDEEDNDVEEGAGGDESERTKRIKGKGVLEA